MKNLHLHLYEEKIISDLKNVSKSIQNPDDLNEIFVCDGLKVKKLNVIDGESITLCEISNEIPLATENDVVDLYFLCIERIIGVVLKTGEVILINVDSLDINLCINQEFREYGINAIGVSPDQELLVFIVNGFVYLVNGLLDVITKDKLQTESFGEREFITVGWGKKETQFHGSEGKDAAKSKPQQTSDLSVQLNQAYVVTWRGDGALFAVGFPQHSETIFKVFNREGVLQYTSEQQIGIECKFVWRPSGNLIATTQIYPNKYVVSFFEKNGLKHGEFLLNLKFDEVSIKKLSWSSDSEALCIWYEECKNKVTHILIYSMSNYQWYLKQSHLFPANLGISSMFWEENSSSFGNKRLHMFLNEGKYVKFEWAWSIHQSIGKTIDDDATVGVINGKKIQLTSFRYSVVPPPMASNIIECPKNINHVVFGPPICTENSIFNSNSVCILMEDRIMNIYTKNNELIYNSLGNAHLNISIDEMVQNILWFTSKTLLVVTCDYRSSYLYILQIIHDPNLVILIEKKINLEEEVVGLKHLQKGAILQTKNGKILKFSLDNGILEHKISFPECCYQFDAIEIDEEIMLFGLTYRNRFYINNSKIANNVSSYFIHSDFLMLTTLQHQLLSCQLIKKEIDSLQNLSEINLNQNQNQHNLFADRRIERGSKLVTVVSCNTRTVLQMPRGNIEVIQPRALSLKIIGYYLDRQLYKEAFDLMRKQRINLNLIYDHNPTAFKKNVDTFVSQITNSSWLSLFITELDKQDVTVTIYNNAYKYVTREEADIHNKVQNVCEIMRSYLKANNEGNKNILPILTTYVKNHSTCDLENALLEIKKVRDEEKANIKSLVTSSEALKYLLLMVNVDDLYNIALGLDDFDLVMFVANKSQKDPKEYVPYLNNLMNLEKSYRKFTIDKDLKRFDSALSHLIACTDKVDELVSFVKQHSLYNGALRQININDYRYAKIAEEFGNYLQMRNYFSEAGIMFKRSLNYTKAIECFIEALEWQSALYVADQLNLSEDERKNLEQTLLKKLKEVGAYDNALSLLENSDDFDEKISCALEGKLYKQALRICLKNNKSDLLEEKVKPAVMEQSEMLLELIKKNKEQYLSQKNRILLVRKNKIEKSKINEEEPNYVGDCDLYSDTSSIMGSTTSKSSGRTYRSSKNRRKHERKMVSLKEGSRYEDIALIRALHSLIASTFSLRMDVSNINNVLHWFGNDSMGSQLQNDLEDILTKMTKDFDEIWPSDLSAGVATQSFNAEDAPTIESYLRIPPIIQECKWKIQTL